MKDRVSTYPNRRLITPIDGSTPYYVDITRADEPTEVGTALNKANLLTDDTAALLGLGTDATVNQAIAAAAEMGSGFGGAVYKETSANATVRTVTIEDVENWDDLLNTTIFIKAGLYGTLTASTLNINGLGAKYLYFPAISGVGLTTTPTSYYWVRTGGIYGVVWDGTYLQVVNPSFTGASASYPGTVQITTALSSLTTTVPTSSLLYSVYQSIPTVTSGSFTPVCSGTSGTGYYRKIGNVVTIAASITFSSAVSNTNSITGLPYVSIGVNQAIATSKGYTNTVTNNTGVSSFIAASSSIIYPGGTDGGTFDNIKIGGSYISAS